MKQITAMHKVLLTFYILICLIGSEAYAQKFERIDSLQGHITEERIWWDLLHYDIKVKVDIDKKYLTGTNTIKYRVIDNKRMLQIDLQSPMKITGIMQNGTSLDFKKEYSAYFIALKKNQEIGSTEEIQIEFEGSPIESSNPPWDGGFVWKKDKNQNPFIANANQLIGSSSWLPSKDIPYDEPDEGMQIEIIAPASLTSVSNGKLIKQTKKKDKTASYTWRVVNPINGYGINMNIGDYVHFSDKYHGENGALDLDFYVLSYNLDKAKKQFKQVPKMLEAFEYWFGPYPFYEDGYKLVEAPYLGMEHQSSVTYGNGYENGYLGGDLSSTGEGLKFDFIIIHESGHEWFANSITNYDVADMWIHEGFTTYSEVLYLDYHFGKESGNKYMVGLRDFILNDRPITGSYEVNYRGSDDMYMKGAAMIHTLRQVINDDTKFRLLLRNINNRFYHKTISSKELESYIAEQINLDLEGFFDQYLRTIKVPTFQYKIKKGIVSYRFRKTLDEFNIPIKIYIDENEVWINPSKEWQTLELPSPNSTIKTDKNFYINFEKK